MSNDTPKADEFPAGPPPAPRNSTFLADPTVDHLMRAVVTLSMELSVTRDRLSALEAVLAEQGVVSADQLSTYQPDAETDAALRARREQLIEAVLGPLVQSMKEHD